MSQKTIGDLIATTMFTSGEPEPPRLHLAHLWPDDGKDSRTGVPLMSERKPESPSDRPHCGQCAGELVRSRVRVFERLLTCVTKARPYRCLDCRARRWR